jgi:hypothetical protein
MNNIKDIQKEINKLSQEDFNKLRDWILEKEWASWDEEIENDSVSGKLDFMVEEAKDDNYKNRLEDL